MSERIHMRITKGEYEKLCEALESLVCHSGTLSWTVAHTGEYLKPRKDHLDLVSAIEKISTIKRNLQCREQQEHTKPKLTIDDWDKKGPCVTVHLDGKQYVGILEEWEPED
tara:strand:+ start:30 stop:362 length:333 start_codon:yes stop_codon:yes gene_type:complete